MTHSFAGLPPDACLAAVVASSDDAIICSDVEGRITLWNPAAERLFGYPDTEALGRSTRMLFPEKSRTDDGEQLRRALAGETMSHLQAILAHKDGTPVEVSMTVSPIFDASGKAIGISKIVRDSREHNREEAAALHFAALVESSEDAIISKDLNGIVMSWNIAAERLFGYTANEMIGRSITTIIPRERLAEEAYVLGQLRAGLRVEHFETVRQAKDGSALDISLTVSPIRDKTGRVIGASKIVRDISEQKRLLAWQRMAIANEEAARRALVETENRRMQENSRLKSEFVANMSHELRTPLNAIIGFAELIADEKLGPLPPAYSEFGRLMLKSGAHLLQLIDDILDLAKVESGRIDLKPQDVDLHAVVHDVTSILTSLAAQRRVQFDVDISRDIGPVRLDPDRFKQVLYNYLSNAVKFSKEDGRISVRVHPEARDTFTLEVQDFGIGISPDDQSRLFVEFQQLDSSTTKQVKGTGLGLALTKRIVEAQGGVVGVRSTPGEGSTFFATLPRNVSAGSAEFTSREQPVS